MSITPIAKEMKTQSYIRLPSLYKDIEVLNLINKIFYKAYGNPHEYDYTPEGIKESEEVITEYKISLKTLKIILFKISITGDSLSHHINEEFLKGNIKPVKVHTYDKYRRNPCNKKL